MADIEGLCNYVLAQVDDSLERLHQDEQRNGCTPDTYRAGYDMGYYHAMSAVYDQIPEWAHG